MKTRNSPPPPAVRAQFDPIQELDSYLGSAQTCDRVDLFYKELEMTSMMDDPSDSQEILDTCRSEARYRAEVYSKEEWNFLDQIEEMLSEDSELSEDQFARLRELRARL